MSETALADAHMIAKSNRLRIVPVTDNGAPAWVVYRVLPGGGSTRLGRRSSPAALLHFVESLAGRTV